MNDVVTRRDLFFGRTKSMNLDGVIRPPWAVVGSQFKEKCTGCGECVSACPENIIEIDTDHLPKVEFSKGECTFCEDCVAVCKDAALIIAGSGNPWELDVSITQKCLAYAAVECRICEDQCEPRAIRFRLTAGGVSSPQLDNVSCTGCGACMAPCPVEAISILPKATLEGAYT